ncbi:MULTISPECIES: TetR/AcrR family transcriptional regulator [unclassified Fusibacter]|uniref:TetR/AcrR family transcriptional regulator n=1 Tax=unclassified Fusibacter TaxID=2624464 RepID=UPI001010B2F4|nr:MULTISPECIES: TetR/AcrR family transcriptional regulator [unclassified Fusibacter]MCK8060084.1 TetR/AcrR family transcriptional regulator [Fusibacter sp. A2]NPE22226.1 TetR/AcrR family transcriptional regulator [Fusibacter sp. A1]RXV61000.1 TetR/AcrR family transcriptional regulator [Fusibacter sp. A1]
MELRERILEAATAEFNEKGIKFTLADISKSIGISKKTIYTIFSGKEELLYAMIDSGFASIKKAESDILADTGLTTLQKIRQIIIVQPEPFHTIDFKQFASINEKYPKLYKEIRRRIESEWDPTIQLLELGMKEGCIKKVCLPVLKVMIEASIEHFLDSKVIQSDEIGYEFALQQMMDILMAGIQTTEEEVA